MSASRTNRDARQTELRRRAEIVASQGSHLHVETATALSPQESERAFHELRVHQFELEMQNEELRRAQDELDAARARYFDLYNQAPVGYLTVSESGRVLEANLTATTLLGLSGNELVRLPLSRFVAPNDQDNFYLFRKNLLATGQHQACELEMVRSDGASFWGHLEASPAVGDAPARTFRMVLGDVSERRRALAAQERLDSVLAEQAAHDAQLAAAEQGREAARRQASELQQRLTERDRALMQRDSLLGMLAHEVLKPLNHALSALESVSIAMATDHPLPSALRQPLDRAQRVLDHMVGSVTNTLVLATQLAHAQQVTIESADIDTVLGLALADLSLRERGRVRVHRHSRARSCELNIGLVRMALRNLLGNAIAYSPAGSPVDVTVNFSDEPPELLIEVVDQGPGIPPELMPVLFEPGTRGPSRPDGAMGAGLGLHVVARVAALHRGRVEVRANTPCGSVFSLHLPQGNAL